MASYGLPDPSGWTFPDNEYVRGMPVLEDSECSNNDDSFLQFNDPSAADINSGVGWDPEYPPMANETHLAHVSENLLPGKFRSNPYIQSLSQATNKNFLLRTVSRSKHRWLAMSLHLLQLCIRQSHFPRKRRTKPSAYSNVLFRRWIFSLERSSRVTGPIRKICQMYDVTWNALMTCLSSSARRAMRTFWTKRNLKSATASYANILTVRTEALRRKGNGRDCAEVCIRMPLGFPAPVSLR